MKMNKNNVLNINVEKCDECIFNTQHLIKKELDINRYIIECKLSKNLCQPIFVIDIFDIDFSNYEKHNIKQPDWCPLKKYDNVKFKLKQ